MSAIPLDVMLWISAGVFALGVFFVVPIWWRNWRVRGGADLPVTDFDRNGQALARLFLTLGAVMAVGTGLVAASQSMTFSSFAVLGGAWMLLMLVIASTVDGRRARPHR